MMMLVVGSVMVMFVVGSVMFVVGTVIVSDVDDDDVVAELVVDDEDGLDDEPVVDDEVVGELVEVDPAPFRRSAEAVTRLLRSTTVTSGSWTPLVPGIVIDSSGAVEDGKTSVRESLPELNT